MFFCVCLELRTPTTSHLVCGEDESSGSQSVPASRKASKEEAVITSSSSTNSSATIGLNSQPNGNNTMSVTVISHPAFKPSSDWYVLLTIRWKIKLFLFIKPICIMHCIYSPLVYLIFRQHILMTVATVNDWINYTLEGIVIINAMWNSCNLTTVRVAG